MHDFSPGVSRFVALVVTLAACSASGVPTPGPTDDVAPDVAPMVDDTVIADDLPVTPDTPATADVPVVSDTPSVDDVPTTLDVPVAIDRPLAVDTPVLVDRPLAVDTPVVVDRPSAFDTPTVTDRPVGVDVPATTDRPDINDVPSTPGACGSVQPALRAHVAAMATMGWGAINRARNLMMWGCAGATRPEDCLSMVPLADASNIGANRSAVTGASLRVLYSENVASSYWTRSSADGRFVGRGVYVHDMVRGVEIRAVGAQFDPAFFPDNSGLMYQPGGRMCPMSVLTTGMPTAFSISGTGSQCSGSMIGLYEHVSAALGGSDYWAIGGGPAAYDNGGRSVTLTEPPRNERTPWGATSATPLTLMSNTGSGFMALATQTVRTPFQGDHTISPSSRLLAARFNDEAGTIRGYIVSVLNASHVGGTISASATEVGRYCYVGTKPSFSYDERYITYHDYFGGGATVDADARELGFSGASDPAFAEYRTRGAANVYVIDLLTGVRTRVTNMGPGQYALFPHFRSDGWMYFLVRTAGTSRETVIASNVLFHLPR